MAPLSLFLSVLATSALCRADRSEPLIHRSPRSHPDAMPKIRATSNETACVSPDPVDTLTDRMNLALNSSGPGYILRLCQDTQYLIQAPLLFAAPNQEISTVGYPIPQLDGTDHRATLVVSGPVFPNGTGHACAINGQCPNCDGIQIRHLRINGSRLGAPPINGGANMEIGGSNSGHLVEYVRSFDPRGWSCLHIMEGALSCTNTTIRYNDIGPCGSDNFQQWSDGISLSCRNSYVHGNWINTATDGGIVIFGSPGSLIENNTIYVETAIMIGGINMVDYNPFSGDYRGTVVRNNTIRGGFANSPETAGAQKGDNNVTAMIKIGIAVGPRTWFGNQFYANVSTGGTVLDNVFTGAFGYAMAANSATNFTISGNSLFGNTSFIGSRGPNCTNDDPTPTPSAFIYDQNRVLQSTLQPDMVSVADADSLTCIVPNDGNYWPFGGEPTPVVPGEVSSSGTGKHSDNGAKIGIGIGVPAAVILSGLFAWFFRKWYLARNRTHIKHHFSRRTRLP